MIKTYKYRLKDRHAKKRLAAYAYAANQVWNYCVAVQRDLERRYLAGSPRRTWPSSFDLQNLTAGTSKELGVHAQSIKGVCEQFTQSRNRHKKCPTFRSSFGRKRARGWVPFLRQSRHIDGNSLIYLGQRYRFFGSKRRPLPESAKGGAFVEDSLGRWWVCFQIEVEQDEVASGGEIGIDLGLKDFAVLSNGGKVAARTIYRRLQPKLAVAQRAGNKRRAKVIHIKAANARRDFHHKLSASLARDYALIAVGNVNAKRLAKTKMAKSVMDAGWSSFRRMLKYKSPGYVEVDENFTTQSCSGCGSIAGPKGYAGLNKRTWECPDCGASHDRDVNAAKNILALARSATRRGDESRRTA